MHAYADDPYTNASLPAARALSLALSLFCWGRGERCGRERVSSCESIMCKRAMHLLMATSAMTMYTQYFSMNDFSRGASTGLPSAVTGGGTRRAGLQGALRPRGRETRESVPPAMNHAAGRAGKQGGSGDNRLRREEKQRARPPQNRIGKESARKRKAREGKAEEMERATRTAVGMSETGARRSCWQSA